MCGIFGMYDPSATSHGPTTAAIVTALAAQSTVRGRDAAGYAAGHATATAHEFTADAPTVPYQRGGGHTIRKWTGPWAGGVDPLRLISDVTAAHYLLGHTRYATQGGRGVTDAAPNAVGRIIATHNGDIDATTIPDGHPTTATTDSAKLVAALAAADTHTDRSTVFATFAGRAAVAWIDTARPDEVNLTRTACTPLALSRDTTGRYWWASNPAWLTALGMMTPVRIPEGTWLTLTPAGPQVTARFTARARTRDINAIGNYVGFSAADERADRALPTRRQIAATATRVFATR